MENTAVDLLTFGEALEELKEGKFISREGWNGKGMYLGLQRPDEHSVNRQPYIWIMPVGGQRVPWVASQADMLAEDWRVVQIVTAS
jgi:hypothetical protein